MSLVYWIAIEVIIVGLFAHFYSRVLCPMMQSTRLKQVHEVLRKALTKYLDADRRDFDPFDLVMQDSEEGFCDNAICPEDERPSLLFNTVPYFFVSLRVAREFPDLIENRILSTFRRVIPNRPYVREAWDYNAWFLCTSCIQSLAALVLALFTGVMQLIPSFEYYMTSLTSWVFIGIFSQSLSVRLNSIIFFLGIFIFYVVVVRLVSLVAKSNHSNSPSKAKSKMPKRPLKQVAPIKESNNFNRSGDDTDHFFPVRVNGTLSPTLENDFTDFQRRMALLFNSDSSDNE